jgi:branched-chain amino acid transport system permease protein
VRIVKHPMFIILAIFCLAPLLEGSRTLATEVMIWAIFAMGFNILLGYTGLPSFGHGLFFGVGAYLCGLAQKNILHSSLLSLLAAMLGCALIASLLGLFVARKRGIYFALLTIAFTQMFYFICFQWDAVTGGENGLMGIERYNFVGIPIKDDLAFYYFVFFVLGLSMFLLWRLVRSPMGGVFYAIKQNEVRAKYLGYNTTLYKWMAWVISAAFGGLAGALHAMLTHGAFADPVHWSRSGDVVMMVIIGGGLFNFFGPVLGAFIFIALRDIFSTITQNWYLFYGLLIVVIVLFIPEGILGFVRVGRSGARNVQAPGAAEPSAKRG